MSAYSLNVAFNTVGVSSCVSVNQSSQSDAVNHRANYGHTPCFRSTARQIGQLCRQVALTTVNLTTREPEII